MTNCLRRDEFLRLKIIHDDIEFQHENEVKFYYNFQDIHQLKVLYG